MMCSDIAFIANIKRIFQYLYLFYLIQINDSKSLINHDECTKFILLNDCDYFPCLDTYYSCGRDNNLVRFSYEFCKLSTKNYISQLTTDAQIYFNHTNFCSITYLNNHLIERKISAIFTCTNLQAMIFNAYLNCLENNQEKNQMITIIDFCSIICENLETIINLFLNIKEDYINLHELLIKTGKSCGAQINELIVHTIPSLLIAICLDRKNVQLKKDITHIMFNSRFQPNDFDWT